MYLLYVDESGDPGCAGSPFLVLGAAAVFEGKWLSLDQSPAGLLNQYFPSGRPDEIHLAALRAGKGAYRALPPAQRRQLIRDFCTLAGGMRPSELVMFAVVAEKAPWFASNPGKSGDDLYAEMFGELSSRFDLFLRRAHARGQPSKGILIADPHKPSLSKALQSNHRLFQRQGTSRGPLYNLVETVFFLGSHESPGLQLADLASYALLRLVRDADDDFARRIRDLFDREPLNSPVHAGRWHGVKLLEGSPATRQRIESVWPPPRP